MDLLAMVSYIYLVYMIIKCYQILQIHHTANL